MINIHQAAGHFTGIGPLALLIAVISLTRLISWAVYLMFCWKIFKAGGQLTDATLVGRSFPSITALNRRRSE
jgi:hypothetical protein